MQFGTLDLDRCPKVLSLGSRQAVTEFRICTDAYAVPGFPTYVGIERRLLHLLVARRDAADKNVRSNS